MTTQDQVVPLQMVFGYVYAIARKQRSLDRDIQVLRKAVERERIEG